MVLFARSFYCQSIFIPVQFLLLFITIPIISQETEEILQNVDTSSFETVTVDPNQKQLSDAQAFLDMGYEFLEKKNIEKAKEYFQKSLAEGEGAISKRADMALINVRAASGEKEFASEMESFGDSDRPEGYYMMADGWESYYFEHPYKTDYLDMAKEYYSLLSKRYGKSDWVQKARLKLASLYIEENKYNFALDHLLPVLQAHKSSQKREDRETQEKNAAKILGLDMAWFLLGRILEESTQYKDYRRAVISYTKVLSFANSPFTQASEHRIQYLRKLSLMDQ